jgi:Spy/CpxP family protein refolding chaperone
MLAKASRWIGIVGILIPIPLLQTISVAKTSVDIGENARVITVRITESENQGSGVIIQRQGDIYTVLTSAHVVRRNTEYTITTPDDIQHPIISRSIRRAPNSIDLAVVKFRAANNYATAKLGNCNNIRAGMDIYVAGFPAKTRVLTQSVFVFREGKVSANSNKVFDAGYSLVYSNNTLPGMSGGAVLNSDGELVAIHGRGDIQQLTDDSVGEKTGFNVGIPIDRFFAVASNIGVRLNQPIASIPSNSKPKADDRIASDAQNRVRAVEQLKLTKDQQAKLVELQQAVLQQKIAVLTPSQKEQVRVAMQQGKNPNLTLTQEQQIQLKAIQSAALTQQGTILTSEQKQKLQQINNQAVVSNPQNTKPQTESPTTIATSNKVQAIDRLKLTKEQQAKLVKLQQTVMQKKIAVLNPTQKQQLQQAMKEGKKPSLTLTPNQQTQLKAIQSAAIAEQNKILTPEQQAKFQEMNKQNSVPQQR